MVSTHVERSVCSALAEQYKPIVQQIGLYSLTYKVGSIFISWQKMVLRSYILAVDLPTVLNKYRMDLNFRGTKLSRFSRIDSHPRKFSAAKI